MLVETVSIDGLIVGIHRGIEASSVKIGLLDSAPQGPVAGFGLPPSIRTTLSASAFSTPE
jgi:hypothetical protein